MTKSQTEILCELVDNNKGFKLVLAGAIELSEFVDRHKDDFKKTCILVQAILKEEYHSLYKAIKEDRSRYTFEDVTCAWITKQRFNENMSDHSLFSFMRRGEKLLGKDRGERRLRLDEETSKRSHLLALMWTFQGLAGKQGFEKGAVRFKLEDGLAPKLYRQLKDAGAKSRPSTHARLTRITQEGLGKDIVNESMRELTPYCLGSLLTVPTYRGGEEGKIINGEIPESVGDFDLLFKIEDYGLNDVKKHSRSHKNPFHGSSIKVESTLAKYAVSELTEEEKAEKKKRAKITRKDHLSELTKEQRGSLMLLYKVLKYQQGEKCRFKIGTVWRWGHGNISEEKILGKDRQLGLNSLVQELFFYEEEFLESKNEFSRLEIKKAFNDIRPLYSLKNREMAFEGNELLIDMSKGKPVREEGFRTVSLSTNTGSKDNLSFNKMSKKVFSLTKKSFCHALSNGAVQAAVNTFNDMPTKSQKWFLKKAKKLCKSDGNVARKENAVDLQEFYTGVIVLSEAVVDSVLRDAAKECKLFAKMQRNNNTKMKKVFTKIIRDKEKEGYTFTYAGLLKALTSDIKKEKASITCSTQGWFRRKEWNISTNSIEAVLDSALNIDTNSINELVRNEDIKKKLLSKDRSTTAIVSGGVVSLGGLGLVVSEAEGPIIDDTVEIADSITSSAMDLVGNTMDLVGSAIDVVGSAIDVVGSTVLENPLVMMAGVVAGVTMTVFSNSYKKNNSDGSHAKQILQEKELNKNDSSVVR